MTMRSEWSHRVAEFKARLQMRMAARLFSQQATLSNRMVKRLLGADKALAADPELEHPS